MAQQELSDVSKMVMTMIRELVDCPDEVQVEEYRGERSVVIEVSVAPADRGKIIGRQGRTANAIRELLYCIGRHYGRSYVFNLIDQAGDARPPYPPVPPGAASRARETSPRYGTLPGWLS